MFDSQELLVIRRAYAKRITFLGGVENPALENAFASVAREAFLGAGPWPILRWPGYAMTPDGDPAWLYADVLVGVIPERGLNNGEPSSHATWIAAAAPAPLEHVVHVGAGVGYYSAILAHMIGPTGRLTAIEYDAELAERAAANLRSVPSARVVHGDGSKFDFGTADVIYVNAGASRPADIWLDRLNEGGRLILPLTTDLNFSVPDTPQPSGGVFRITRRGDKFEANFVGRIAVYPCEGMRDEMSERALAKAFQNQGYRKVRRLRRTDDVADAACWVKAPGWSLTFE